jgi:cell division protein FtsB
LVPNETEWNIHLTGSIEAVELERRMNWIAPNRSSDKPRHRIRGLTQRVYRSWRRGATVAAAILTLALVYQIVFGQNGLTAYQKKRQDMQILDRQSKSLEEENETLEEHVQRLQDDPGAIEHQAREELHYTRPGEVIVTLPNDTPAKTTTTAQ